MITASLYAGDYEKGWDAIGKGDFKTALTLWRPLAEQGHSGAQSNLALIYCNGDGVLPDFKECTYWAKKARAQGEDVSKLWNDFQLWKYDHKK